MVASLWTMILCIYDSDDGNAYNVGISTPNQSAGGFSASPTGEVEDFPKPWRMRYVLGKSTGLANHKLPIAQNTNALYQSGGSYSIAYLIGTVTFATEGRIGEKRTARI